MKFVAVLLGLLLAAPSFAAEDFAAGPVIAKGRGLEIRRSQLDDAFVAFRANLAARGQAMAENKREAAEVQLLDRMIVTQLLVNKATEADKINARTNTVKFLADSRRMANTDDDFVRHLKSLGMTQAQFTNRVTEQAISEEVIVREVKSKITIAEADMKRFWETNDAAFRQPELARARHILFATKNLTTDLPLSEEEKKVKKAKAEAVLDRARKGEDFLELALAFSEDPGAKENKAEYRFARAKDDPRRAMVPEFENMAFSMKTNEISDIVTTSFGYHIIKLLELIPPQKTPYEDAKERIREYLMQTVLEKKLPEYFATLKKEAGVEILDEKLNAAMAKAEKDRAAGTANPGNSGRP